MKNDVNWIYRNETNKELLSVPWPFTLQVFETLRKDADIGYTRQGKVCKGGVRHVNHSASVIVRDLARNLELLLMVGFLVLIPPETPQTYCELEVGRTLIWGTFQGLRFIPVPDLEDLSQAKWWIGLLADNRKTGRAFGEWWGEVPNIQFRDGRSFYHYIEEWLTVGRHTFAPNTNHNFFFTQENGKPFEADTFRSKIKQIFVRLTGLPISPQILRHAYLSYLGDIDVSVSNAELESTAYAMHWSRRMQVQSQDLQEKMAKLAPSFNLSRKIAENYLNKTA